MRLIALAVILCACAASSASAAPVVAIATTVATFVKGSVVALAVAKFALSVGISALAAHIQRKKNAAANRPVAGIRTDITQNGGVAPLSFIVGLYATAGTRMCPPMWHGQDNGRPNAYLTEVISIGDLRGHGLRAMWIDGETAPIDTATTTTYGHPIGGKFSGSAWIKYYDGSQTSADPAISRDYGSFAERPWTADMIGKDLCYAIITLKFNPEVFRGVPTRYLFEVDGIALYDPRKDSTVGGTGAQRWGAVSTYARSQNPAVIAYNILRGITLPDQGVWGGEAEADDLPLVAWFGAMNTCDAQVTHDDQTTQSRYRCGYEIIASETPRDVLGEIMQAANMQIAEIAGSWKPRAGGPALALMTLSDDDVIVSAEGTEHPFPGLETTHNAVAATYPDPGALWQPRQAPLRTSAGREREDTNRRSIADLQFNACPFGAQVQRLMREQIEEERRFRRHIETFPPDAQLLEPLDSAVWTSPRHGYANKNFEVFEIALNPDQTITMSLRERSSADYVWQSSYSVPAPAPSIIVPALATFAVPGFSALASAVVDASGTARRPAIKISWSAAQIADATGIEIEVRLTASSAPVHSAVAAARAGTFIISEGILSGTGYSVRARMISRAAPTAWTTWTRLNTQNIGIAAADFGASGVEGFFQAQGVSAPQIVAALPSTGNYIGRMAFLTSDSKLYRYTSAGWTAAVPAIDISGQMGTHQLAAGSVTGNKMAANTITAGLLATSGLITNSAQINDGVITNAKIGNLQVTTAKIAFLSVGTEQIKPNAVTAAVSGSGTKTQYSPNPALSLYFNGDAGAAVVVTGSFYFGGYTSSSGNLYTTSAKIYFNGALVSSRSGKSGEPTQRSIHLHLTAQAGSNHLYVEGYGANAAQHVSVSLLALMLRR